MLGPFNLWRALSVPGCECGAPHSPDGLSHAVSLEVQSHPGHRDAQQSELSTGSATDK